MKSRDGMKQTDNLVYVSDKPEQYIFRKENFFKTLYIQECDEVRFTVTEIEIKVPMAKLIKHFNKIIINGIVYERKD